MPFRHKTFTNLGYFVVKGENGAPVMEKDPFKFREDHALIYIFTTIKKADFDF